MNRQLTAIIEREGDSYVALCPELDIASQGNTVEDARKNLCEAVELFFECASPQEVQQRHPIGKSNKANPATSYGICGSIESCLTRGNFS